MIITRLSILLLASLLILVDHRRGKNMGDHLQEREHMSSARLLYLKTVGLENDDKSGIRKAALDRAHEIREFEIELYWKRANYFWLLQAAVFAAVGLTWKAEASLSTLLPIGLAGLGVITSFAGWLAAKGSKFWQRNWEHQIDMLEGEFEGNLYKTIYVSPEGVGWSLTGVSERLSLCFVIFWILTLIGLSAHLNHWTGNPSELSLAALTTHDVLTFTCWALTAFGSNLLMRPSTGIEGRIFNYPDDRSSQKMNTVAPTLISRKGKRRLIRREPNL
jgi:hypothetical protein